MNRFARFLLVLASIPVACQTSTNLETVFQFDSRYPEVSGMVYDKENKQLWALQDKGNPAELLAFDLNGNTLATVKIAGVKNNDWEELAKDQAGNLYIGDFGNNGNDRTNLQILKINRTDLLKNKTVQPAQITSFYYPNQTDFPAKKKDGSFDCEAMIVTTDFIYLFSKNKNTGLNGQAIVYRIPNQAGRFAAEKLGEIHPSGNFSLGMITAAALSPDGKTGVLLTHHSAYTYDFAKVEQPASLVFTRHEFGHKSQKEAITFESNTQLLLSDESKSKNYNYVYRLNLN